MLRGTARIVPIAIVLTLFSAVAASAQSSLESLIAADHWKQARVLVEARLKANPADPMMNFLAARVKEAAGDYAGALPLAEKAVALNPDHADSHCLLGVIYGRQLSKAGILRQLGLIRRFRKECETALRLNPRHVEARLALIEFYFQAPGIAGGDKAKAHALAEEITAIDPVRGYIAQASLARRERKNDLLESFYLKAVAANPKSYEALVNLAGYYSRETQDKIDLVEKYAKEALDLEPGRIQAYGLLSQCRARLERWPELDQILERAEKNVPDNLVPYFQAGRIVFQQGKDPARAERYFRKYLSQESEATFPSAAQAYWRLGQTLEKMNRKSEAVEALQTAIKVDSSLEGAKRDLKRIR
jgi:tetratricopeptide (TPR) repeat protein